MEKSSKKFISPIAIDLGSKNTGLFYLHYENKDGEYKTLSELQTIPAFRKTLALETGTGSSYQLLMVDRTQRRHQRRGYTRRKLAKRLAKLILEEVLNIPAKPHLEALGFLLNRRGFSYTTFEIDESILRNYPSKLLNEYREDQYAHEKLASVPEFLGSEDDSGSVDILEKIHVLLELGNVDQLKSLVTEVSSTKRRVGFISSQIGSIKKIPQIETDLQEEMNGLNREYYINRLKNKLSSAKEAELCVDDLKKEKKELRKSVLFYQNEYSDPPENSDTESLDCKQYFTWALYKTLEEAQRNLHTGHKPRKQYSQDIYDDLSNAEVVKGQPISKSLCDLRDAVNDCSNLGLEQEKRLKIFCNLLGNISNLQIKPLRQYFNNISHREQDKWEPVYMCRIYVKWLRSWRPRNIVQKKLRNTLLLDLENSDLISHWLRINPKNTIPPYENNNNRRPPKCNSLILTPSKLSVYLPDWREITDTLVQELNIVDQKFIQDWINDQELRNTALERGESVIAYSKILQKSGTIKSKAFSSSENMDDIWKCRTLAFILDRSNGHSLINGGKGYAMRLTFSSINLNSQEQKERAVKTENALRELLREKYSSFESFANQYFSEMSLAKEGRLFLENGETLLDTCSEKPKQKRHQSIIDIAGIFGITVEEFKKCIFDKIIESEDSTQFNLDENVQKWLTSFRSLKAISEKSSKAQKQYGNELNEAIQSVQNKVDSNIQLDRDERQLYSLVSRIEELAKRIGSEINTDYKKFNSIFSFAQLYNVGFSERSGFSSTCKLCAYDNVRRMQRYKGVSTDKAQVALAPRISGISVRVIDGVVRKLFEHKARAIAKLKWTRLQHVSRQYPGASVSVPILIEQNSFDFEKNLSDIKRKNKIIKSTRLEARLNRKKERIKLYSEGVCPYSGELIGEFGELDHILSRSFTKGVHQTVFNSEFNLLYVSSLANRTKNNDELRLNNLHTNYLYRIFRTTDCELIEKNIELFVENFNEKQFSNFLNLDEEDKRFIRHALFLSPKSKARKKVERMLNSSQRTRVNGTQRYFAALIAKYLSELNNQKNVDEPLMLSFDYLEIDSLDVYRLRSSYAEVKHELKKEDLQSLESHSVDAAIVFLMALKSNNVRDMLGVEPPEIEYIGDNRDRKNRYLEVSYNTVLAPFYEGSSFRELNISRKPTTSNYYTHRPMFRDNFYAGRYLPIVITCEGSIGFGFSEKNMSQDVSSKQKKNTVICNELIKMLLPFSPKGEKKLKQFGLLTDESSACITKIAEKLKNENKRYIVLPIDRSLINEHLIAKYNTKMKQSGDYRLQNNLVEKSAYRTEKVLLNRNMANDLLDILQGLDNWKKCSAKEFCKILNENKVTVSIQPTSKKCVKLIVKGNVVLPIWKEWKNFLVHWEKQIDREDENKFDSFCKEYFRAGIYRRHQKTRNKFGLPMVTSEGKFLQSRRSWTKDIQAAIQITNDGDPRKGANIYQIPMINKEGSVKFGSLAKIYQSKSLHRIDHQQEQKGYLVKRPTWFKLNLDEILSIEERKKYSKLGVVSIYYLVADLTRPMIRVNLNKLPNTDLFSLSLLKPRSNKELEKSRIVEQVETSDNIQNIWTLVYKGERYPSGALKSALRSK